MERRNDARWRNDGRSGVVFPSVVPPFHRSVAVSRCNSAGSTELQSTMQLCDTVVLLAWHGFRAVSYYATGHLRPALPKGNHSASDVRDSSSFVCVGSPYLV